MSARSFFSHLFPHASAEARERLKYALRVGAGELGAELCKHLEADAAEVAKGLGSKVNAKRAAK